MALEQGPIRPPSEAFSLLVRVTRGCPWNRCSFCPVYKGSRFSIRTADEVLADIAELARLAGEVQALSRRLGCGGEIEPAVRRAIQRGGELPAAAHQLALFLRRGGERAFLQDANSLVMPAPDLVRVLEALRRAFPSLTSITSYARAHTLTRRTPEQLVSLRRAGLTRLHVGLESGSDRVLALAQKGVDAARQIEAGRRARAAGFELSEYVMPGLGGRRLSREHALESARVLNEIGPHQIRLRSTAVVPGTPLADQVAAGTIEPLSEVEMVAELRLFLEQLEVSASLRSDHDLNLLGELDGELPADRPRLLGVLDRFLSLEPRLQQAFILGRRTGLLGRLDDLDRTLVRDRALELLDEVTRERELEAVVQGLRLRSL